MQKETEEMRESGNEKEEKKKENKDKSEWRELSINV